MSYLVNTPCGLVQGCPGRVPGTAAYKGIRYASAGRWKYPVQVTCWEGIYDATQYGNCSYQPRAFYDEEKNEKKYFYYNEFRRGEEFTYSDDCLFLNIFTPENSKAGDDLPVLLYIHGGGFSGGCGHEKHFDCPVWPTKGVIGVTINYRLGPMGFLCLPELKEEAGHTGNYGLYDQMTAMKWVRDNIVAFGGDPKNITIMGQSAGAMSVQLHCQSALTDGLFSKAVMSSGCGMMSMMTSPAEKHFEFWQKVKERCGCCTLDEFRSLPAETLFGVWQETKKDMKSGAMAAFPVKDNRFIGMKPQTKQIPYLVGSTSHDMAPPILFALAKKWCVKQGGYAWFFDRMLPGDNNGAWHSSDLWYWFGTLPNCWRPMEEKDYALSDQMTDYLCNFVAGGDPNGTGLPIWNLCTKTEKRVLSIGEADAHMGRPSMGKLLRTMLTNKAVGE